MADFEVPKLHPWPLDHDPPFPQQTSMLHFVDDIYIYIRQPEGMELKPVGG